MCELLGISAKRPVRANEILREFFSHSSEHPHGWGLARIKGGAVAIEKEPVRATASAYLKSRLETAIEESALIAHIRLATVGDLEYANCHPFSATDAGGRTWTFAHNGTIFLGSQLDGYFSRQKGSTDSERVFMYLLDRLAEARPQTFEERFDALSEAIQSIAGGNKLNLLFHDGEYMYAHTNFRGSLHYCLISQDLQNPCKNGQNGRNNDSVDSLQDSVNPVKCAVISTRPLETVGGEWREVPFTRLVAFRDGEVVREGRPHGLEYFYNPNDYKALYLNWAQL